MNTTGAAPGSVVVVGESLVDVVHRVDGSVHDAPGGSCANVALTLGRLGRRPQLVTRLGRDARGRIVRDWLEDSHVRVSTAPADHTATATARLDASGAASYEFDLEWRVDTALAEPSELLHVGSIGALLEPGATAVLALVEQRRASTLVTFDPNVRPSLLDDAAAARRRVDQLVALADVVKASDDDLDWLQPGVRAEEVAATWLGRGPSLVVVTTGGEGGFALTRTGLRRFAARPATVVDTVGAGDTFMGTLIDGVLSERGSKPHERLHDIPDLTLDGLLARSAAAAAVTVSRAGANPPWASELDSLTKG